MAEVPTHLKNLLPLPVRDPDAGACLPRISLGGSIDVEI
jgi:hypothetical protein